MVRKRRGDNRILRDGGQDVDGQKGSNADFAIVVACQS
jgi:hypothetical protein